MIAANGVYLIDQDLQVLVLLAWQEQWHAFKSHRVETQVRFVGRVIWRPVAVEVSVGMFSEMGPEPMSGSSPSLVDELSRCVVIPDTALSIEATIALYYPRLDFSLPLGGDTS